MRNKKPICQTYPNGTKYWFLNGKLHRKDGPAMEWPDGTAYWYLNGKFHRESGPAINIPDGSKYWYLNGKHYIEPDFYRELHKRGKISREELFIHLL